MSGADTFRELREIPKYIEDVLWFELDAGFYQQCNKSLKALTDACTSNSANTSFYGGAGISVYRPSRLPLAHAVIKALFEECLRIYPNLEGYSDALETALSRSGYVLMENVFQHLYECTHPKPFHAGHVFDIPTMPVRYNVNHTFLARWLNSGRGTVVTPNLDPLIEHAWQNSTGRDLNQLSVIRRPNNFDKWQQLIDNPDVLWKLHGSSNDAESWAITLSRVGFSLKDGRASFIHHVVSEHNVCFMGYRAADLDLFPPILKAHTNRKSGSKIFWVFYFREGYTTLADYLQGEPNIARLFEVNPDCIHPIVTTAERLSAWLQSQCLHIAPVLPPTTDKPSSEYDYRKWLAMDIETIGESATRKLIGYTLRILGEYDAAITVLDDAAELLSKNMDSLNVIDKNLLKQIAELLQESAHAAFQINDHPSAISKVRRAQKLLKLFGDDVEAEFGLVSMILDGKSPIRATTRLDAILRLLRLHWRFIKLSRYDKLGFSPILGQGLCLFYEGKILEKILSKTPLIRVSLVRRFLIGWYGRAGNLMEQSKFLNSMPDIKRRQALLWASLDPQLATQEMIEALRIARIVSEGHFDVTRDRARLLLNQITEPELRLALAEAMGDDR